MSGSRYGTVLAVGSVPFANWRTAPSHPSRTLDRVDRGTRINVLKKVATRLEQESWPNMNVTLREFGLRPEDPDNRDETTYEYLLRELGSGTEEALLELHSHLFPDDPASGLVGIATVPVPWNAGDFRLFISHTTAHKARAIALSTVLEPWGVDGFVAHEDIEPTAEWKDVIGSALHSCDAMCALLTPDFPKSPWCDQECGVAIARRVVIVPVDLGKKPYGFVNDFQALPVPQGRRRREVADDVFMALARNHRTRTAMPPRVVRRLEVGEDCEAVPRLLALLQDLPNDAWTDPMIDGLDRAIGANMALSNAKLADGTSARDAASELLQRVGPEVPVQHGDDDIPF